MNMSVPSEWQVLASLSTYKTFFDGLYTIVQVLTYAVGNSIKKTDDSFKAVQVQGTAIVDWLNRDKLW